MSGYMESVWRSRPWRRSAPYESYERAGQRPLGLQLLSWLRILDLLWSATCKPATRQGGSWMVGFHANEAMVYCLAYPSGQSVEVVLAVLHSTPEKWRIQTSGSGHSSKSWLAPPALAIPK
ncbi:predicted protein [Verticillium alfalfae VaMs.102]|uniref:Predicted protein n=1 Tax=Verticillium alfalfae (strain VaMs.102 / ATCC MYA-4576 / FGSC 10136) TaxID=526221 RepID=C9SFH6_VERA1|nr:predicted protein [Verticillium alfalfae VaMs.102]EEY17962.1 predicted protein [Verticillium alfalfae VaMs.102]